MDLSLRDRVRTIFNEKYGTNSILVFAPGRINLIGEHTDYNDGFVFPAAIDLGIITALSKNDNTQSNVFAIDVNESISIDVLDVNPIKNRGWRNYILGVVSELQKFGKEVKSFNAAFSGNIPKGSGLGSSAALENSFVLD